MGFTRDRRNQGVSLRLTYLLMMILSVCIMGGLFFSSLHTLRTFRSLSKATDVYIDLEDAASSLLKGSDNLTQEAQRYSVLGKRENLDNYFTEAEVTRSRDRAINEMEALIPESEAMRSLRNAMAESVSLMNREYYAMKLMMVARGDQDVPAAMRETELSAEDLALSPAEQALRAAEMMHDDEYYAQKNRIRLDLNQCIDQLKQETHGEQNSLETRMNSALIWMLVMIVIQTLMILLLLWVTTSLGINPLLQAVEHIKRDQKLPITGANEFRYLAGTYNNMYSVYKKSIENLSFKASHDELTGVYNRAGFDLIKQSVDMATTAFLLVDADLFKRINDQYGHETGDRVLKKLASALQQNFRADDYISRLGGDEFMVLMVHITKDVTRLIENKVIQINQDLADTQDGLPAVSVSVGVAMCRENGDPQQQYHDADVALYYVKEHGRNGCCFYRPEMREQSAPGV